MVMLKCVRSDSCSFTVGRVYEIKGFSEQGNYEVSTDGGQPMFVDPIKLAPVGLERMYQFEIINLFQENISDEYEEEEWQRLEKKSEDCKCDVAFAYQLSRIQKYLRDYDSTIELVVTKGYLAIITEDCKEFRGNVEQIIDYIRLNGEIEKLVEGMDRRN